MKKKNINDLSHLVEILADKEVPRGICLNSAKGLVEDLQHLLNNLPLEKFNWECHINEGRKEILEWLLGIKK